MWFGNLEGRKMKNRITYEATVAKIKRLEICFLLMLLFLYVRNQTVHAQQIKYDQFKEGRAISHILFKLGKKKEKKPKASRDKNTVDLFNGMTDKQIIMFADKLSRDTAFQNHFKGHVGELEKDYAIRIGEELIKPDRVLEWLPYLKAVGYVPSNK